MEAEQIKIDNTTCGEKKPHSAKKIVSTVFVGIGIAIALFLVVVIIWLCVEKYIRKKPVPFVMGIASVSVLTGSMQGTIDQGSLIWLRRADDYKVGDIITFLPDGDTIPTTHRIIKIENGYYYTQGDANNAPDIDPIRYGNICGKVVSVWKNGGYFNQWLSGGGWIFFALMVVVIAAAVVLWKKLSVAPVANVDVQNSAEPQALSDGTASSDATADNSEAQLASDAPEAATPD